MSMLISGAAQALCKANNESPDGSRVKFLNDGMFSETFLQMRSRDVLTVALEVRDAIQAHAESLPLDDYGPWRRVVEWLDAAMAA